MTKFGQIPPKLLVGRRSCFDPPTLCNRPSSHYGRVHTTQKHRKPLPATLHHARRARDGPVGRNPTSLALRPSPTRRPLHTKLRLRALRVCSCTSKHPPRRIAATRNAHRVGCHLCLEVPLLYINSAHESALRRRLRGDSEITPGIVR